MLTSALAVASLLSIAHAFSDTLPVVAWSSHRSTALDSLASAPPASNVHESLLLHDEVCDYDGVVIVDQPGLRAADLRALAPSSALAGLLTNSPSSVQLPYVRRAAGAPSAHDLARAVQQRCGSRLLTYAPGAQPAALDAAAKHVVCVSMPSLAGTAAARKTVMAQHDSQLAHDLERLARAFPKHLVVLAGAPAPVLARRQAGGAALVQQPGNATLPAGGILKRYQLLTPALITALLVAFFVLIPVVLVGVAALASIQNPHRVPPPPDFDALEKRD